MKKVVRFNFEDGAAYYSGTTSFVTMLGGWERYSDEAMTWADDIENAYVYNDEKQAEIDAKFWREVFAGCPIDVIDYPQE